MIKKAMIETLVFFTATLASFSARAVDSVTIASDPGPDVVPGYIVYTAISGSPQAGTTDVGYTTQAMIGNLVDGQTYVSYATAYDKNRVESDPSNVVTYTNTVAISNQPR